MVLQTVDEIERSFLANIERGEQALQSAENDYQRLEVREAQVHCGHGAAGAALLGAGAAGGAVDCPGQPASPERAALGF